jgi:Family of unknown function (DUF5330)
MFFLIRAAFWLSVVLVLLPTGSSKPTALAQRSEIGALEAVSAASATMSDMGQFCTRQPEACAIGSQAATVLGQRAQAGAKMVYEFINERMETGSIAHKSAPSGARDAKAFQHTLTPTDLAPPWRGSVQGRT